MKWCNEKQSKFTYRKKIINLQKIIVVRRPYSVIMIRYYPSLVTWVYGNWRPWRFCGLHRWLLESSCYCQASPLLSQKHFDALCKWHTVTDSCLSTVLLIHTVWMITSYVFRRRCVWLFKYFGRHSLEPKAFRCTLYVTHCDWFLSVYYCWYIPG